jgi:hypothetical protein
LEHSQYQTTLRFRILFQSAPVKQRRYTVGFIKALLDHVHDDMGFDSIFVPHNSPDPVSIHSSVSPSLCLRFHAA